MKIYYLTDTWPWFGEHQCYGRLVHYIRQIEPHTKEVSIKHDLLHRIIGRTYSFVNGYLQRRDSVFAAAEYKFLRSCLKDIVPSDIYHILFFDNHYPMFERWDKTLPNVIGTVHLPLGRKHPVLMEKNLRRLSSAITMYNEGVEYFEKYVGEGRVKFIHYGVDTDFFHPTSGRKFQAADPKYLFFTGHNGRNFAMLKRVAEKLLELKPDLHFDILMPRGYGRELECLTAHARITWHEGLSESEVRGLYQNSYLLLMPMNDSGVNTAIVEGMACGLPIVTTDIGGIRDYGGGSIYPVVKNDDDDAMIALVEQYLASPDWRDEIGRKCREFAEQKLAWPLVAQKHLEAYRELIA